MRIRTLGRSGLRVSELCLGAMTFGMPGWGCDEDRAQLDENLGATAVSIPDPVMERLEAATRLEPEYPGAMIDFVQTWLGNR